MFKVNSKYRVDGLADDAMEQSNGTIKEAQVKLTAVYLFILDRSTHSDRGKDALAPPNI